jgi:hypothetical protein
VCTPISKGRLGTRNLSRFSLALLGTWLWRCGLEREAWWWINIEVYGEGGVLVSLMGLMGWVYGRTLRRVEGSSIVTPDFIYIFFFDKSKYYIKKKRKVPLSTQEREHKAPQVYKGNPNQQHKERINVPLST